MPDILRKYCKIFAKGANLYLTIEKPDDQEELQRDSLTRVSRENNGYWSIIYINVYKCFMEMLNMSLITK